MAQRRQLPGKFKAEVAIEAIKDEKTINEIASIYEVDPNQASKWKKRALQVLPEIMDERPSRQADARGQRGRTLSADRPTYSGGRFS